MQCTNCSSNPPRLNFSLENPPDNWSISNKRKENKMGTSVYKIIELVGTSSESWEKAAAAAIKTASKSIRDLRIAEIAQLDMQIEDGKVKAYRAKVKVSFKYHGDD
jgi:flavin-binding protein dodecin